MSKYAVSATADNDIWRCHIGQELFAVSFGESGEGGMSALEGIVADPAELPKEFPTIPDRCYEQAVKEQKKTGKA